MYNSQKWNNIRRTRCRPIAHPMTSFDSPSNIPIPKHHPHRLRYNAMPSLQLQSIPITDHVTETNVHTKRVVDVSPTTAACQTAAGFSNTASCLAHPSATPSSSATSCDRVLSIRSYLSRHPSQFERTFQLRGGTKAAQLGNFHKPIASWKYC